MLGPADAPAAAVLTQAFDQEPAKLAAMLPNSGIRRTFLAMIVKARLYDALHSGTVHGVQIGGELGAIALWYSPSVPML